MTTMQIDRAVVEQALEALEWHYRQGHSNTIGGLRLKIDEKALRNLKAALAQQAEPVEPVAWGCNRYIEDDNGFQIGTDDPELAWGRFAPDDNGWWPLYTAPPQRKPLTEEEIDNICRQAHGGADPQEWARNFARAVERAHGIGGKDD